MSLIVETGTGSQDSEAYLSAAEADAYFAKRGISIWGLQTGAEKEQALVRATDFMLQTYRQRWKGARINTVQALDWPRAGVVIGEESPLAYGLNQLPSNQVPKEVKNACAELALRASIGALSEDVSPRILQETVGPITTKYDQYAPQLTSYTAVDGILRPLLKSSGGGAMVKLGRC